jgi:hypothetical protein
MVYYACFRSVRCGVIFWGNSSYANHIFHLQKRVIRIMTEIPVDRDFLMVLRGYETIQKSSSEVKTTTRRCQTF